ncbi:putative Cation transport regulator-like protein 2 [Glarea lozoyensis 74030]|uniref:glutathione-specific gamma-glutamylcyclotransferase n=1 Tax=Glarea lozoyensis (strain ATCC 74030 / MF5533) TaxID=1104152 RepID=H0ELQ0_GLAL7|nr:putative Cation transport regulator-like protein 2 [Glarea lozoyensis 74030]
MSTGSNPREENGEFWLFGYGLCDGIRPEILAGICSFHQDHRGTPEAPGRVVTLIERSFWETLHDPHPDASDKVWGIAYRIEKAKVDEVKDYLDIREINGYSVHYTQFYPSDGSDTINTLVYIGTPDNDQFMGPQDPQKLAEHIHRSVGPSGPNIDYLLSLEVALDSLSTESGDEHIKDLANRVRKTQAGVSTKQALDRELEKNGSTDEQEETEKPGFGDSKAK